MTSSISSSHGWAQTLTSWKGFFVVFDLLSSFASCHAWRKSCGDFSSFVPARKKIFMQILIGLSVILPRHFLERQASKGSNLLVSCPCLSPFLFPFPDSFPSHAFPAKTAALKLPFFFRKLAIKRRFGSTVPPELQQSESTKLANGGAYKPTRLIQWMYFGSHAFSLEGLVLRASWQTWRAHQMLRWEKTGCLLAQCDLSKVFYVCRKWFLVGGFNPFEKYSSKWGFIFSQINRGEH